MKARMWGVAGIGNATGKAIVGSSTSIGVVTLGSAAVDTIYANDFGEPGMGPFYWYAQPPSATDAPVPTNTTAPATLAPASSAPADGSAAPANRSEAPGTGAPQTGAPQTGAPAVPTEGPVDAVPGPTNAAADEEEGSGGGGGNDTVWIVVVVCLVLVIMCLVVLYCRAQRQRAESDQAAADRKLDSFHSAMSEHRTVELQHVPQSPPYGPCPPPPQPPPPLPPLPPGSPAARRVSYDRLDSSLRSDADYPLLFWPGFGRDSPSSPHRAPPSADASVRGFRAAGREPKTAAAYDRIAAMYAKYNPEQAHTIDALIDKYGDEALLKTLVDKYGPEPESPAVLAASVNSTVLSQPGHRGSLIPYSGSPLFPQANVSMHSLQSHFPPSSPATHSRRRATLNAALVS
ncbi:hypothetical protein DIPPA_13586 [Diplonema papillatum]|nr:hypothetical protein DIPPA_08373 [Diplonema papillatum]KAJ9456787.1 hypothetical protein DIPPA_13586 [Diplonema papillatum]